MKKTLNKNQMIKVYSMDKTHKCYTSGGRPVENPHLMEANKFWGRRQPLHQTNSIQRSSWLIQSPPMNEHKILERIFSIIKISTKLLQRAVSQLNGLGYWCFHEGDN